MHKLSKPGVTHSIYLSFTGFTLHLNCRGKKQLSLCRSGSLPTSRLGKCPLKLNDDLSTTELYAMQLVLVKNKILMIAFISPE